MKYFIQPPELSVSLRLCEKSSRFQRLKFWNGWEIMKLIRADKRDPSGQVQYINDNAIALGLPNSEGCLYKLGAIITGSLFVMMTRRPYFVCTSNAMALSVVTASWEEIRSCPITISPWTIYIGIYHHFLILTNSRYPKLAQKHRIRNTVKWQW